MFKVILDEETDRVEVYKDGKLVGECEAYELDAVVQFLEVAFEVKG